MTLDTLVATFDGSDSPEEIHAQYPTLVLGDVYAVLTYCVRRRGLVQAYLAERASAGAAVRAGAEREVPPDGLRERLLARLSW